MTKNVAKTTESITEIVRNSTAVDITAPNGDKKWGYVIHSDFGIMIGREGQWSIPLDRLASEGFSVAKAW